MEIFRDVKNTDISGVEITSLSKHLKQSRNLHLKLYIDYVFDSNIFLMRCTFL